MNTQAALKSINPRLLAVALVALGAAAARADMWDYCARGPAGEMNSANFTDTGGSWNNSSAMCSISTTASRVGCRYFGASSGADGTVGFSIQCTGDSPCAMRSIWRLWYGNPALSSNSKDLVAAITASAGTTLDANLPTRGGTPFTTPYATYLSPSGYSWASGGSGFTNNTTSTAALLCYFTNEVNVLHPTITFRYVRGGINASSRWYAEFFRFERLSECCTVVPSVCVQGPIYAGQTNVTVTGVRAAATAYTVYVNGPPVYTNVCCIIAGTNTAPVPPLLAGQMVFATQTIAGQEGCLCPCCGTLVRNLPAPTTITNLLGATLLNYGGGDGEQFVLLGTNDLAAPVCTWPRLATNTHTPGAFYVPPPPASTRMFYRVHSE